MAYLESMQITSLVNPFFPTCYDDIHLCKAKLCVESSPGSREAHMQGHWRSELSIPLRCKYNMESLCDHLAYQQRRGETAHC